MARRAPSRLPRFRRRKTRRPTPGAPPGTLMLPADSPAPGLRLMLFDAEGCEEREVQVAEAAREIVLAQGGRVRWLDVQGLGDESVLRALADALGLHPLSLEDLVHPHQRPKLEAFDGYLLMVLRNVRLLPDGAVENEQLGLVLREGLLVTFQERPGDGFDPVRLRLRQKGSPLRRQGADGLAHALVDELVDLYFPVLELYADSMDQLDEQLTAQPARETFRGIHAMKRELRALRRAVWPLRDLLALLGRGPQPFVGEAVRPAFRDCLDHALHLVEFVESARERADDLADLYLATVNERTNQVMKLLTVIATIFIPLTFLAGVYGMNFKTETGPYSMPELGWPYGYVAFWGVSLAVALGMLWVFRRRGFFRG
jgi:magnesium transporter